MGNQIGKNSLSMSHDNICQSVFEKRKAGLFYNYGLQIIHDWQYMTKQVIIFCLVYHSGVAASASASKDTANLSWAV